MPSRGFWQITEAGERNVEAWAQRIKKTADNQPNWVEDFKLHALSLDIILNLLLSWGLQTVSEALNSGPSRPGFGLSIATPEAMIAT